MRTLIIAEPGMCWEKDLSKAYGLIDSAKAAGADCIKFQWTSNGRKMQQRRRVDPKYGAIYEAGVQYPPDWLELLKFYCDSAGIEFMCTTYLPEDIPVIESLVNRFKVSAYESQDEDFIRRHVRYDKEIIVSINPSYLPLNRTHRLKQIKLLHCQSIYPTPIEKLKLSRISEQDLDGYSDHSANVLAGAAAVACGAEIVEVHIKDAHTPIDNPDYGHSLFCSHLGFEAYVRNIRTVEAML